MIEKYYYDEKYIMSVFYAEKAMEIKDEEDLHLLLAQDYMKQNDIDKAMKKFEYLISRNPNNIEYVVNLANIYIKNHNYLKARKVLKNYIKLNPKEKNNPRFKPCWILII